MQPFVGIKGAKESLWRTERCPDSHLSDAGPLAPSTLIPEEEPMYIGGGVVTAIIIILLLIWLL